MIIVYIPIIILVVVVTCVVPLPDTFNVTDTFVHVVVTIVGDVTLRCWILIAYTFDCPRYHSFGCCSRLRYSR